MFFEKLLLDFLVERAIISLYEIRKEREFERDVVGKFRARGFKSYSAIEARHFKSLRAENLSRFCGRFVQPEARPTSLEEGRLPLTALIHFLGRQAHHEVQGMTRRV